MFFLFTGKKMRLYIVYLECQCVNILNMNLEPPKALAEKISQQIEARMKAGETLTSIAARIGMDKGHLSNIKSGKKGIDATKLYSIAVGLGVKPGELLPDSWRASPPNDNDATEGVIKAVLNAYFAVSKEHNVEFASPDKLAEIIMILLNNKELCRSTDEIRNNLILLSKLSSKPDARN